MRRQDRNYPFVEDPLLIRLRHAVALDNLLIVRWTRDKSSRPQHSSNISSSPGEVYFIPVKFTLDGEKKDFDNEAYPRRRI